MSYTAGNRAFGERDYLCKGQKYEHSSKMALGKERPSANLFFAESQALDKGLLSGPR
jgi:hypothetical protein